MGFNPTNLWKLFRDNRFAIHPKYYSKVLPLLFFATRNAIYGRKENAVYGNDVNSVHIEHPPIFILGHWRSGTSFFHRLLTLDEQFNYPNVFQIYNPHTFLYTESLLQDKLDKQDAEKRPMDNMAIKYSDPGEEEFAVAAFSVKSPVLSWSFPKNSHHYDRYITLKDITEEERTLWKQHFLTFLKKLTVKDKRPLVLKSPANTGRIKTLLELFPEARFIHIHRNPYHVYQSTMKLYEKTVQRFYLQKFKHDKLSDEIIHRYRLLYDSYLEDYKLIPDKHFFEVSFEQLENDFEGTFANIYEQLGWRNNFDAFKSYLHAYLQQQKDYKKNTYPDLNTFTKNKIAEQWQPFFKEWNYSI